MSLFAGWPPELISGMIYSGPGSGPMMAAAAAWDSLAADLQSTATSFQSVLSGITGGWQGPSAATMTSSTEPYLSWIQNTALQAEQAGAQAKMAGTAFDTAFAATVPPPEIAANRALLMALIATNFFGQNTAAIAATEAQYAEMWAQDVGMMNSYALASTEATTLESFAAAPTVANGALSQAITAPLGLANSLTSLPSSLSNSLASLPTSLSNSLASLPQLVPTALTQLVTPTATASAFDPTGILSSLGLGSGSTGLGSLLGGTTSSTYPLQVAYYGTMIGSTPARMFMGMGQSMANSSTGLSTGLMNNSEGLLNSIGQFVDGKMQLVVGNVANQLKTWGSAVSAQLAHATTVGHLSVPQAWSSAAPAMTMTRAAPVLPATTVSATTAAPSAGMPGGPFTQALMGALSGRGLGSIGAKTPKVVPRSPAGG